MPVRSGATTLCPLVARRRNQFREAAGRKAEATSSSRPKDHRHTSDRDSYRASRFGGQTGTPEFAVFWARNPAERTRNRR